MLYILPVLVLLFLECPFITQAGNVVIFPMLSRSQLLNAARIATTLAEDGHNVTIVIPSNDEPDIKTSPRYNLMFYKTSISREKEQQAFKDAVKATPLNFLLGKAPTSMIDMAGQRCIGLLFDDDFARKLEELKPDVAIVHVFVSCIIPHLIRMGVPFLDFCSVTFIPGMCGHPHRVPAPPSYVPDGPFQNEPTTFPQRVFNTLLHFIMPQIINIIFSPIQKEINRYQEQHKLPYENTMELRSKASFLLVNGDLTFETIRPLLPKVVYIGGIQCDAPAPLDGELKEFIDASDDYTGVIVFSLGGILNTEVLPLHFLKIFFDVFRALPLYRVVWRLSRIPEELKSQVPANVKIVRWMPQQDLLGHRKTKLHISHGGIQGAFESIYHGVATLGVPINGDQGGNIQILVRKGMALSVDDYRVLTFDEVKEKINRLLTDDSFQQNAIKAQLMLNDQPLTVSERLKFAVDYTIRHKGAHHLTSKAALQLHWFQYYSLDVALFLMCVLLIIVLISCFIIKTCFRCCVSVYKRTKKSKAE